MTATLRWLAPLTAIALTLSACGGKGEGANPGECSDGADNDENGKFDCDDPGCSGSPDCDGSEDEEADADTDADADADADADGDADADTDTDTDADADGDGECVSPTITAIASSGGTYSFDSWAWEDTDFGAIFVGYETGGSGGACSYAKGDSSYSGTRMTLVVDDPSATQGDVLDIGAPSAPTPPPATIPAVSFIEDSTGVLAQSSEGAADLDVYSSGSDAEIGNIIITYDDGSSASGDLEACYCAGLNPAGDGGGDGGGGDGGGGAGGEGGGGEGGEGGGGEGGGAGGEGGGGEGGDGGGGDGGGSEGGGSGGMGGG